MADDHGHDHPEPEGIQRNTAPQQEFGTREVAIGMAVLAVGLALTFGIGAGLTL